MRLFSRLSDALRLSTFFSFVRYGFLLLAQYSAETPEFIYHALFSLRYVNTDSSLQTGSSHVMTGTGG